MKIPNLKALLAVSCLPLLAAPAGVALAHTYHCMTGANGTGLHTGTDIVFKQRGFPS